MTVYSFPPASLSAEGALHEPLGWCQVSLGALSFPLLFIELQLLCITPCQHSMCMCAIAWPNYSFSSAHAQKEHWSHNLDKSPWWCVVALHLVKWLHPIFGLHEQKDTFNAFLNVSHVVSFSPQHFSQKGTESYSVCKSERETKSLLQFLTASASTNNGGIYCATSGNQRNTETNLSPRQTPLHSRRTKKKREG